jgi:hypothetical protein
MHAVENRQTASRATDCALWRWLSKILRNFNLQIFLPSYRIFGQKISCSLVRLASPRVATMYIYYYLVQFETRGCPCQLQYIVITISQFETRLSNASQKRVSARFCLAATLNYLKCAFQSYIVGPWKNKYCWYECSLQFHYTRFLGCFDKGFFSDTIYASQGGAC